MLDAPAPGRLAGLTALVLTLAWTSTVRAEDAGPPPGESLEERVERVVTAQLAGYRIPGALVVVVHDGKAVLLRGYGEADTARHVPVDGERTLFRVASVGKLFIWTAVMRLVEQGRLDLDTDLRPLLGEALQQAWKDEPPLTLAHLMAHTGGFEVPERLWPLGPPFDALDDYLERYRPARVRPPGVLSAYSDYGTCLAQRLVERVTGRPFEDVLREDLWEPLGMHRSQYRRTVRPEWADDTARGHLFQGGSPRPQPLEEVEVATGGSLLTTAPDLARFMRAHLQGGALEGRRILREETVARMHRQHFTHEPRLAGWAHGFMEFHRQDQRLIGHTGDAYLFYSLLALVPERGWGFFVSYNGPGERNAAQKARLELLDAVLAHDVPAPRAPAPPASPSRTERFSGGYQTTWRTYDTAEASLGWRQEIHVRGTGPGTLRVWQPGRGAREWVEVEPRLFRPAGPPETPERLAFREDTEGNITHLFLENRPLEAFERAPWYATAPVSYAVLGGSALVFALALLGAAVRRTAALGVGAALGLLHLLFIAGFTVLVRQQANLDYGGTPWLLTVSRTCASAGVALTPLVLGGTGWAWWKRAGSRASRGLLTALSLAATLFALWLHHWHLLAGG